MESAWGGDEWDIGYGVAINNSNEIYITGFTESYGVFGDLVLMKYNSTGDLQWYETFGGADTDVGYNLEIDSNDNIYIAGYTSSFGAVVSNGYLIKYNRTRDLEWNKTWGGNLPDDFYDLIIDENNDIFICGNSKSYSTGLNDITILKYNSTGDKIFNYSWGGAEQEYAYSISIDSNNNTYITGYTKSYGGIDKDAYVIKFNETGNFQWYKLWGQDLEDEAFGLSVDDTNNIFITGKSQILGSDYDFFLTKYTLKPDNFMLGSNAGHPDHDGNFTLTWDISLDAYNCSLYQFDKPITKYNDSLIELVKGNTNRTFEMKNLGENTYYFMAIAFNEYGNTSSNCLKVIVQYPPEGFDLFANDENPDTDGKVNLTWTDSIGAYNYSVYSHSSYIHEIYNNGTLVIGGLTNNSYLINDLSNGEYYYAVVAINPAGQTTSNCSKIIVRRKADYFVLYSNAGSPDSDGTFDLIWTKSEFSKNYTIYFSTSYISEINHTVQSIYNFTPEFDWPTYKYSIYGKRTGTYYYKVVAFNEYGNFTSKCLIIEVIIRTSSSNGGSDDGKDETAKINPVILPIIFFSVLGILIGIFIYISRKRGKF